MRSKETSLPHPGAVLSAAERLDRLPELGRRVRDLSAIAFQKVPSDTALLFVNLHTHDLLDPTLYDETSQLTRIAGRVALEITERASLECIEDDTRVWFQMYGVNLNLAADGSIESVFDGPGTLEVYYALCEAEGLARPDVLVS